MGSRRRRNTNSYSKPGLPVGVVIVFFLLLIGVLAYGIATLWQNVQEKTSPTSKAPDPMTMAKLIEEPLLEPEKPIPIAKEVEVVEKEVEPVYPRRLGYELAVAETPEAVGYDYFSDAIFFGDSISTGIAPYMEAVLPEIAVVATTGVSVNSAAVNEVIPVDGVKQTMLSAAENLYGPRSKVYVMLGSNGLDMDKESFKEGYTAFVKLLKVQYPEGVIYLQSMTPVTGTPDQEVQYPSLNNPKINEYNLEIMQVAKEQDVYYLDVAVAFLDDTGILPADASPDGVHFPQDYYFKWFDYLMKHTITPEE